MQATLTSWVTSFELVTTTETVVDNLSLQDDAVLKVHVVASIAFRAEVELRGARAAAGKAVSLPPSVSPQTARSHSHTCGLLCCVDTQYAKGKAPDLNDQRFDCDLTSTLSGASDPGSTT